VNGLPCGDHKPFDSVEITTCEENTVKLLARYGLNLAWPPERVVVTTPMQFNRMFPTTGGSLYGRTSPG
jgi:1-hydroxycarotenoid 3,4-desaturase